MFQGPAIALLELESIARGYVVADAAVKKAEVRLLMTEPVSPGKFLVLFEGEVAEVEEAFKEAVEVGGAGVIDRLLLTQVHPQVGEALRGRPERLRLQSLGIVETTTAASAIVAADRAAKAAEVTLVNLHLARGIGGKGYFTLSGSLDNVEAAVAAAATNLSSELLVTTEVIASPHGDLAARVR